MDVGGLIPQTEFEFDISDLMSDTLLCLIYLLAEDGSIHPYGRGAFYFFRYATVDCLCTDRKRSCAPS